jgi:hypothetical protein
MKSDSSKSAIAFNIILPVVCMDMKYEEGVKAADILTF